LSWTPFSDFPQVMIWDDNQNRCIGELSFRSEVRAVRLRRDRIVVVLEYKIYVYNFADLKVLHQIETWRNVKGICGLSQAPNHLVLACPGTNRTQVGGKETYFPCLMCQEWELALFTGPPHSAMQTFHAASFLKTSRAPRFCTVSWALPLRLVCHPGGCHGCVAGQVRVELFDLKKTYFIRAHESELACLALSLDGKRLATASTKGTSHPASSTHPMERSCKK